MREQPSEVRVATTRQLARGAARYGVGVGMLLALAVLSYRLALAPIHGVRDAAGCARAYAAARTHGDTLSAASLSYPDPHGRGNRRCFELRPLAAGAVPR